MQRSGRGFERRAKARGDRPGGSRTGLSVQPLLDGRHPLLNGGDQLLGFRSGAGLLAGGLARGGVGALASVDGQAQREAVITLTDGGVVASQCLLSGSEFRGRVVSGAGGTCRFHGALRLIAFLGGRFRAGHDGDRKGDHRDKTTHSHEKYSRPFRPAWAPMIDLSPRDRPREKLEQRGVGALGDNELLAVLIGHGAAGASTLTLANQILTLAGGAHGLTRLHRDRLTRIPGIGPVQASRVQAAVELGRRTLLSGAPARPQFLGPSDIAAYLLPQFGAHPVERFGVLLLDTRHRLISARLVSTGSLDASVANPREIYREALVAGAAAVVVFHNHPSGDANPSIEDMLLTVRLRSAGDVVGVDLVDHLVLADVEYCSMRESRLGPWRG